MTDDDLLRRAEAALAEIDRSQGLADEHANVLAALRIRLHGGPRENLDELLKAAGTLKGKRSLEDAPPPRKGSFEDVLKQPPKKPDWPGL
ncbi:MAG: hypothetical protein ACRDKW_17415 [Actinomycetota bacterium]